MGKGSSKPEIVTPEFKTPWRKVTWGNAKKTSLIQHIKQIEPSTTNLKSLKVILIGPAGSGKSTFINSVNNVFQGRITCDALSDAIGGGKSFTQKYKELKIKTRNSKLSIVFNDVMGLENESEKGCHPDDIIKAISGYIKHGHEFNPAMPISPEDPDYNKDPDLSDEIFCVVYVLAADRTMLADNILKKLRDIRLEISRTFGLPQVIVLTNVDQICSLVKTNLQRVYYSKKIRAKMEQCSAAVGVSMNHIFPVKNYSEEIETNDDMDVLILQAFTQIMHLANDNVEIRSEIKDS